MRLIPYDRAKLSTKSIRGYGKNQQLIEEFANSDLDCVRVEGWTHKDAKSAQWALQASAKKLRRDNIRCITSDGEIYLIKTEL